MLDDDLNRVVNNKNRLSFNKEDLWHTKRSSWHREGLGVWDFLLKSSRDRIPEEDDIIHIWRVIDSVRIDITCKVLESHMQSTEELGEDKKDVVISSVSGRSVIQCLSVTISILEQENGRPSNASTLRSF